MSRGLAVVAHGVYRGPVRRAIAGSLTRNRRVTRPRIELARGGAGLDGLRIAFLSDVHAGNYFAEDDWLRVCEEVAREAPELICLGGDLVNAFEHEARLLRKGLGLLTAPLGVFAVPGNHEYQASAELRLWRAALEEAGVEILCNRGRRIARGGAGLWLCGVDDLRRGEPDLEAALAGRTHHEPAVLLSHHPDLFVDAARAGVDLQLSGHTHGGQIVLAGWAPMTHSRFGFRAGHFAREGAQLYVGSGIGTTFLPLRIGAASEIAIAELRVSAQTDD
ncbi:MAG TPA: metallophosphoesterase [Myxococcota bacterium]|nr:metallophosphoesterase [Myxococcota bacterium]